MPSNSPPIENVGNIDIVGARKDGGVDLFIVTTSRLNGDPATQQLLLAKIQSYLEQLNTPEFQAEFKHPPADKTLIVVNCKEAPDLVIKELITRAQPWVQENHARLEIQVEIKP